MEKSVSGKKKCWLFVPERRKILFGTLGIGQFESFVHILFSPFAHEIQNLLQRTAFFRNAVLHPRGHLRIDGAPDQTIRFQFPQLIGQRPLPSL